MISFTDHWQENVYSFGQKLVASKGIIESCDVNEILKLRLPGCLWAKETDAETDRTGVDWIATLSCGRSVGVDVKMREKDCIAFGNDDLALETWSVVGSSIGWTRDKEKACEWVLWVWKDTGRFFLVPFLPLCAVFCMNWQQWKMDYRTRKQKSERGSQRWESECVFVPRDVVVEAITEWYAGNLGGQDGR